MGSLVVMGMLMAGTAPVPGPSAADRTRTERIAALRAKVAVVAERDGVYVTSRTRTEDRLVRTTTPCGERVERTVVRVRETTERVRGWVVGSEVAAVGRRGTRETGPRSVTPVGPRVRERPFGHGTRRKNTVRERPRPFPAAAGGRVFFSLYSGLAGRAARE